MQQKLRKFSETICHKKNRKVHIVHNYHHHADERFTHTHPHRSQGVESQLGERKISLSKKEKTDISGKCLTLVVTSKLQASYIKLG